MVIAIRARHRSVVGRFGDFHSLWGAFSPKTEQWKFPSGQAASSVIGLTNGDNGVCILSIDTAEKNDRAQNSSRVICHMGRASNPIVPALLGGEGGRAKTPKKTALKKVVRSERGNSMDGA